MITDYRKTEEGKRRFENPEIYQQTLIFQENMRCRGVAWHNHFANECTIDFCCCQGDNLTDTNYKHFIPSFRDVVKVAVAELYEEVKHLDSGNKLKEKFDQFAYNYE